MTAGLACLTLGATLDPASAQVGLRVNPAPITAPITGQINRSLNVMNSQVSRCVSQLSNQVNQSMGQLNTSVNRSLNTINSYNYGPGQVRYTRTTTYATSSYANGTTTPSTTYGSPQAVQSQPAAQQKPIRLSKKQIKAMQKQQESLATSQAALGILPPALLTQLTPDQIGLQNAAQAAAIEAQIGETIEWTYEGVSGSAKALSEHKLGTLLCRDFEQTITLNDVTETATGSACGRGNGQWAQATY